MPTAMWVALLAVWELGVDGMPAGVSWAMYLLWVVIFVIFAVHCHRLVLLGPQTDVPLIPGWSWRETRFLLWGIAIYLVLGFCIVLFSLILASPLSLQSGPVDADETAGVLRWVKHVTGILATYVVARMVLVLPASAVDHKPNLRQVWMLSRGNGWRLAIIVGGLPWAFSWLIDLANRDGASIVEWLFLAVAGIVLLVVEIAALSLSYRYLVEARDRASATD